MPNGQYTLFTLTAPKRINNTLTTSCRYKLGLVSEVMHAAVHVEIRMMKLDSSTAPAESSLHCEMILLGVLERSSQAPTHMQTLK